MAYSGLRLGAAVFVLGSSCSVVALGALHLMEQGAHAQVEAQRLELSAKNQAGRQALAALTEVQSQAGKIQQRAQWYAQKASSNRALALVVGELEAAPPERLGVVDADEDKIIRFSALGLTEGATLSAVRPVLARLQQKALSAAFAVDRDERGVWAIGPAIQQGDDAGLRKLAFVPLLKDASGAALPAITKVKGALGNLAVPQEPPAASGLALLLLIGAALLAGILAWLWAHLRFSKPLSRSLAAARDFSHGVSGARAEETQGGREAKDIAREINALIERAERLNAQGASAQEEDIQRACSAIELLGQGDLNTPGPQLGGALRPIAQALEQARRDLLERVNQMHQQTQKVISEASRIAPAAKRSKEAAKEQRNTLHELGRRAEDTTSQLNRSLDGLQSATTAMQESAKDQRRKIQEIRGSLSSLSRKVMVLRGGATQIHDRLTSADSFEQALAFLSRLAERTKDKTTKSKSAALVGEGRSAFASLKRDLVAFKDEVTQTAHSLELLAQSQPEPAEDLDGAVTGAFKNAASLLVRNAEFAAGSFKAMERSGRELSNASETVHASALAARSAAPQLQAALSQIRLGTSFEETLLKKLDAQRAELTAGSKDGLSPEGQAMLQEVSQSSAAARAKLARLVQATEAAIDALRG